MTKREARKHAENLFNSASNQTLKSFSEEFYEALAEARRYLDESCQAQVSVENLAIAQVASLERKAQGNIATIILRLAASPAYRGALRDARRLLNVSADKGQRKVAISTLLNARLFLAGRLLGRAEMKARMDRTGTL